MKSLTIDLEALRAREQATSRQNADLNKELSEKEKIRAQQDLEFKSLQQRYEQLVNSTNELKKNPTEDTVVKTFAMILLVN
jgi:hypothetical protein